MYLTVSDMFCHKTIVNLVQKLEILKEFRQKTKGEFKIDSYGNS